MIFMRSFVAGAIASGVMAFFGVSTVLAQSGGYPNKPMRWVVPYAAGGGTDVISRPIANKLGEMLGQPVVYDNRGGGSGLIAGEFVAKSAPDGYTFLVAANNTHVFSTLFFDKVPFDPVKDFAPITNFASIPNILVANTMTPARTVAELVAYAKSNPGKLNAASSGSGSGGHLALVVLAQMAGYKFVHVPFKGAGPAVSAVLAGDCDIQFSNTGVFLPQIKAGKLRVLGVAGSKRLSVLPDVPLFSEIGFPGLEVLSFYGLMAPAGTPAAIIRMQRDALVKIVHAPDTLARFAVDGAYAVGNTPEQFAEELRVEVARWSKVIRENNIKAD